MEQELLRLAERQHSVFTHGQALTCGLTVDAIRHRVRVGRWETVARGVYAWPVPRRRGSSGSPP